MHWASPIYSLQIVLLIWVNRVKHKDVHWMDANNYFVCWVELCMCARLVCKIIVEQQLATTANWNVILMHWMRLTHVSHSLDWFEIILWTYLLVVIIGGMGKKSHDLWVEIEFSMRIRKNTGIYIRNRKLCKRSQTTMARTIIMYGNRQQKKICSIQRDYMMRIISFWLSRLASTHHL